MSRFRKAMISMSEDEVVDYIIENCKEYLEYKKDIVRYIASGDKTWFKSNPISRVSRDNANHYTVIMSNTWKDYPKRNKSFICTLNKNNIYGYYYDVIPEDGSKWGVAPRSDIWSTFKNTLGYPDDFFRFVDDLSKNLGLGVVNDTNYKELRKDMIRLFDELKERDLKDNLWNKMRAIAEDTHDEFIGFFQKNYEKPSSKIFDELINIMKPENNDFKLLEYKDLENEENEKEIWTDSPCVFVKKDEIDNILNKINEKLR